MNGGVGRLRMGSLQGLRLALEKSVQFFGLMGKILVFSLDFWRKDDSHLTACGAIIAASITNF